MKNKLRAVLGNKVSQLWLVVLVMVVAALVTRWWFMGQQAPTLADVLSGDGVKQSLDFSILIASLLALSLATVSAAKGYEIYKRNRGLTMAVLPEELSPAGETKSETLSGLREDMEELAKVKVRLQRENLDLKERLGNIVSEVEEITRAEKMLRRSNVSLSRECERLKAENELLLLKINSIALRPKGGKGKTAAKTKSLKRRRKQKVKK